MSDGQTRFRVLPATQMQSSPIGQSVGDTVAFTGGRMVAVGPRAESIWAHTLDPSEALRTESIVGATEPGKLADVLHFAQDLRDAPPDSPQTLAPRTIFGGDEAAEGQLLWDVA